jgi:hypothetical protein
MLAGPLYFRSIAATTRLIKVSEGMAFVFPVATPTDVLDIARQVGSIYLASLSALLRSSTGYALACDGGDDNTGIKYFDIRVTLRKRKFCQLARLRPCWLCRPTDQDSNVESKECLAIFRMLVF